jgi:hypothetical protein
MKPLRWGTVALSVVMVVVAFTAACRATYVVVPAPGDGYTAADTLRGYLDGEQVRVVFRFDTVTRTRTRVDTILRVDTLRAAAAPRPPRRAEPDPDARVRVDTVFQVDTLRVAVPAPAPDGRRAVRVDTVHVTDTQVRVDTVFRVDTLRTVVTDTVVRTETVRVPGQRVLFVPPGQYPPDGQCRVWIHDRPPGQQERPGPCDSLGDIPAGAFVLFGGQAWDFDYDWAGEAEERPGRVPREILALIRQGRR